jgi:hypothetical protein
VHASAGSLPAPPHLFRSMSNPLNHDKDLYAEPLVIQLDDERTRYRDALLTVEQRLEIEDRSCGPNPEPEVKFHTISEYRSFCSSLRLLVKKALGHEIA